MVCEICRYPSGEHARDCRERSVAALVDNMMADALGLKGLARETVLAAVEESRAAARPEK